MRQEQVVRSRIILPFQENLIICSGLQYKILELRNHHTDITDDTAIIIRELIFYSI